jgi:hypothetical protein
MSPNATVTRTGIVDQVQFDDDRLLVFCHIITIFAVTRLGPSSETGRAQFFGGAGRGVIVASLLAIDHINKGDGSVVPQLAGLPDRCPLRLTGELLDSGLECRQDLVLFATPNGK